MDVLHPGNTQSFGYDSLNRLYSAFSSGGAYNHIYNYDSFGNMLLHDNLKATPSYSIDSATNRIILGTVGMQYNPNGTLASDPHHSFWYTAEGYLRSIDNYNTGSYLYNGSGERTLAVRNNATWNEYVYLNGQPMADLDSTGKWTDYIYANGKKIAMVDSQRSAWHLHGTVTESNVCYATWGISVHAFANQTMQPGDKLVLDFKQAPSTYVVLAIETGSNWVTSTDEVTGQTMYAYMQTDQAWHHVRVNLSSFAASPIQQIILASVATPGQWDIWVTNAGILHADGSFTAVSFSDPANVATALGCGNTASLAQANVSFTTETVPMDQNSGTNYYLNDHLGTTQIELAAGGWPVWQGQFTPFGQEIINGATTNALGQQPPDGTNNRYKFTGKERDAESGLDYFGARYYASSMGRFMSPDWADKPEDVPYASMDNPQSLNLYGYVYNNPLSRADADGHWPSWDNVKTALDVASFIPVVGDVASAASGAISLAQGHYGEAALSFAAAIPIAGVLAEGGKAIKLTREAGIAINRARGLAGEAKVGEEILAEGGKILGSHVGVQTEKGLRVVDKLVSKDAKLGAVEVKTGGATRTAAQVAKDESMAEKGGKIVGKNAPEGLRGQTVKLPTEVRKPQP